MIMSNAKMKAAQSISSNLDNHFGDDLTAKMDVIARVYAELLCEASPGVWELNSLLTNFNIYTKNMYV